MRESLLKVRTLGEQDIFATKRVVFELTTPFEAFWAT